VIAVREELPHETVTYLTGRLPETDLDDDDRRLGDAD
jgi:hypothetical protein